MGRKRGTKPVVRRVGGVAMWWLLSYPLYLDSSKNSSVVLHTPESLFDLYGKAVRGELPSPLFPLRQATSGLLVSTIPSSGIFTEAVLSERPNLGIKPALRREVLLATFNKVFTVCTHSAFAYP